MSLRLRTLKSVDAGFAAALASQPSMRGRVVSILAPILTFLQLVLAMVGKWVGGLHVLNAILILGMYGWLTYRLRHEQTASAEAPTIPVG